MGYSLQFAARYPAMDSLSDRLKKARKAAGFATPTDAARAMSMPPPTYLGHENGTTGLRRTAAIKYAKKFGVSIDWLLTGSGISGRAAKVPVICYIGAGAELHPIDDHAQGQGIELVEPPQGLTDCVAAIIRGDSMHPLRDGWLIFWSKKQDGIPEECLGQLCVVQVKDGPTMVKEVRKGARGRYTLISWNAPPREDIRLEWASKILDIRPR